MERSEIRRLLRSVRETGLRCVYPGYACCSSNPAHQKKYEQDDDDNADDTHAAVTVTVAVATEAATEAAEQEDDQDDDKYESDRHHLSPVEGGYLPLSVSLRPPTAF